MNAVLLAFNHTSVPCSKERLSHKIIVVMRISLKRMAVLFLSLIAVLCGLFVLVLPSSKPPTEKRLVENFYAHRAAFERLRDMLLTDKQVRAVYARFGVETTESGLPHEPSKVNFPVDRYGEYRGLLEQIGGTEVFRAGGEHFTICISVWASGFGGDTRHVDDCWLAIPPVNQVGSLSDFYKTPKPRHPVFKHIDGNWYLWADW
jgi:hypothetical protein